LRTTLEKAVGTFRATDIMGRVAPAARPMMPAMKDIADLDARHLFNLLRLEQPQTIAYVLSFLPVIKASQVLTMIAPGLREQVVSRLATLAPTPVEVMDQVLNVLNARLGTRQTRPLNQSGGVTTAADILNGMDKKLSRSLLETLDEQNAEVANAIREKMFTFEDLSLLSVPGLQRILREVDTHDLALALKKCSDKLTALLFSAISRRASETVREEMDFIGTPKVREIEASQQRIVTVVRQLEADGEVDLEEARRGGNS
jgi:flagellar motor switch protein FliG